MDLNFPLSVPFSPGPSYSFNSCCCCSPFWLLHVPNVLHNIPEAILNFFLWVPPSRLAHCTPVKYSIFIPLGWLARRRSAVRDLYHTQYRMTAVTGINLTTLSCSDHIKMYVYDHGWFTKSIFRAALTSSRVCSPIVSGSPYTQKMLIFSLFSLHT